MAENKQSDREYRGTGSRTRKRNRTAKKLAIPKNTLYSWIRANRPGTLDLGPGFQSGMKELF